MEIDSTPSSAELRRGMWLPAAIGCTFIALLFAGYDASQWAAAGDAVPWPELAVAHAVNWYLCLAFVPAVARLTARLPVRGARWPLPLAVHAAVDLLLAIVKLMLFILLGELSRAGGLPFTDALAVNLDDQLPMLAGLTFLAHLVRLIIRKAPPAPEALPEHFAVRDADGFRLVRPQDILWADAQGNYARLHTASGRHLLRSTMAALERALDPGKFVRIHRRMIVNTDHVERIDRHGPGTYWLRLTDGAELRSARSYNDRVSRLLA